MALPILNDIKNELERLYVAGSALAQDDPRVKKFVPVLNKLGERAPVFKSLADKLAALTQPESSPENLMDAGATLFSIMYSQGRTDDGLEIKPLEYSETPLAIGRTRYSELSELLDSINPRAYNCHDKLEDLYTNGRHREPRLYKTYIQCVKQGNERAADITARLIIPSLDASIIPLIESGLDIKGGDGDARLFNALYDRIGNAILPLSERVLAEGSPEVLAAALATFSGIEKYTEILKGCAKDRRKIVREAAERALSSKQRGI